MANTNTALKLNRAVALKFENSKIKCLKIFDVIDWDSWLYFSQLRIVTVISSSITVVEIDYLLSTMKDVSGSSQKSVTRFIVFPDTSLLELESLAVQVSRAKLNGI